MIQTFINFAFLSVLSIPAVFLILFTIFNLSDDVKGKSKMKPVKKSKSIVDRSHNRSSNEKLRIVK